jgi:hypothetical protein
MMKRLLLTVGLFILLANTAMAIIIEPPMPPANDKNEVMRLERQQLQLLQQMVSLQKQIIARRQHQSKPTVVSDGFSWVTDKNGQSPKNAIVAAKVNGKPLTVCQVAWHNGLHPGQITATGCRVSYGGKIKIAKNYKVLTGKHKVVWLSPSHLYSYSNRFNPGRYGVQPAGAQFKALMPIVGGQENGRPLYICRTMAGDHIVLGKRVANKCNIAFDGSEIQKPVYQVLFG